MKFKIKSIVLETYIPFYKGLKGRHETIPICYVDTIQVFKINGVEVSGYDYNMILNILINILTLELDLK